MIRGDLHGSFVGVKACGLRLAQPISSCLVCSRSMQLQHVTFAPSVAPVRFRGSSGVSVASSDVFTKPVSDGSPANITWLTCARCGKKVARSSDRIEVNNRHEHTFINPAGVIYRIGCFAAAPGTAEIGRPSAEFAWFRGHRWRCLCCSGCETHLGWTFKSDTSQFCGLILDQLSDGGAE